jgi:hypothetical protein
MASGFVPGGNNLIVASKFARLVVGGQSLFSIVDVAADSALEAECAYDERPSRAQNLVLIHFLWELRQNTGNRQLVQCRSN